MDRHLATAEQLWCWACMLLYSTLEGGKKKLALPRGIVARRCPGHCSRRGVYPSSNLTEGMHSLAARGPPRG